jgi:hypothetical protein
MTKPQHRPGTPPAKPSGPKPAAAAPRRHKKKAIPKALREALWLQYNGDKFRAKCQTPWCSNEVTAWDFQAGHNIPESKGGPTVLENLRPICSRCNQSMANNFTFDEWCRLRGETVAPPPPRTWGSWTASLFSCRQRRASIQPAPVVQTSNPARR